jgi:hypothetical protein
MLDSRIGKILIILFTACAIVMPIATLVCGFATCGHYLVYPIMPWAYIFTQELGFDFSWAVYPVFLLLNISAVYFIGALVEWLYHIYNERRS